MIVKLIVSRLIQLSAHINTQIHKYTMHKYTNTQVNKHTDTQCTVFEASLKSLLLPLLPGPKPVKYFVQISSDAIMCSAHCAHCVNCVHCAHCVQCFHCVIVHIVHLKRGKPGFEIFKSLKGSQDCSMIFILNAKCRIKNAV